MEAKHTPGPWVQFSDRGRTIAIMPAGRPGEVCAFDTPLPSEDDARLIAAAPDLLAALRECASRCRYDGDLFHDQGIHDRRDASWRAADIANAAIAKATAALTSGERRDG